MMVMNSIFIFVIFLYTISFSYGYINWKNGNIQDEHSYEFAVSMDKERLDNSNIIYSLIGGYSYFESSINSIINSFNIDKYNMLCIDISIYNNNKIMKLISNHLNSIIPNSRVLLVIHGISSLNETQLHNLDFLFRLTDSTYDHVNIITTLLWKIHNNSTNNSNNEVNNEICGIYNSSLFEAKEFLSKQWHDVVGISTVNGDALVGRITRLAVDNVSNCIDSNDVNINDYCVSLYNNYDSNNNNNNNDITNNDNSPAYTLLIIFWVIFIVVILITSLYVLIYVIGQFNKDRILKKHDTYMSSMSEEERIVYLNTYKNNSNEGQFSKSCNSNNSIDDTTAANTKATANLSKRKKRITSDPINIDTSHGYKLRSQTPKK